MLPTLILLLASSTVSVEQKLGEIEASTGGHIGLAAINTGNSRSIQYHADERFPLCSTFKVFVAAAILQKTKADPTLLQKRIVYSKSDMVKAHSPITEKHKRNGMTIADLSAAAIQYSDNTAANLLMKQLGGPEPVTTFMRSIGDESFRLDRWEPELNSAEPGDRRDTSTPLAIMQSLRRLLIGDALTPDSREQLQTWMKGNTTGNSRIRAGVSKDWIVGDKTGTCAYGTTNDIAIIWPPQNAAPLIVAIYFRQKNQDANPRDDVIASVANLATESLCRPIATEQSSKK